MKPLETRLRPSKTMLSVCAALGVMLWVGIVYSPLLTAGFANRNDGHYLYGNGRIWNPEWSWSELGHLFEREHVYRPDGTGGYYQPLTAISLRLDAWITQKTSERLDPNATYARYSRPFQFHLTNLLLHVASTGLVFWLVYRLSGGVLWAILLTFVFALHPAQVESVASVAQRMTLLGGLYAMLSLACYVASNRSRVPALWHVGITLFYAAAMLCRPLFIALPVVMLTLDVWPFRREGWRPIIEKVPMFAVLALSAIMQWDARASAAMPRLAGGVELITHNFATLFSRLVFPFRLTPYQPMSATAGGLALGTAFDIALILLIVLGLFITLRRSKPLFAGLVGAVLLMLPALLDAPFTDMLLSDQYLYLGLMIPIIVLSAWLATRPSALKAVWGRWTAIGAAAVALTFSVHAYAQTFVWESSRTLWEQTVRLYPDWMPAHVGLVESLIEENEFDVALMAAQRAAEKNPDDPSMQFYIGTILLLSDDSRASAAIQPLREALKSNPEWIECLQNLGVALVRSGHDHEAIQYLEKARDLQPASAGIRLGLGNAYLKVSRFASARREFQEALRHRNDPMAHLGLAIAWAANDEFDFARRHLEAAIAKDPGFARRAGHSPELRKLRHLPGFDELIDVPPDDVGVGPATEAPAARRAHGL